MPSTTSIKIDTSVVIGKEADAVRIFWWYLRKFYGDLTDTSKKNKEVIRCAELQADQMFGWKFGTMKAYFGKRAREFARLKKRYTPAPVEHWTQRHERRQDELADRGIPMTSESPGGGI